jgi:Fe-S-cluster containining protein
MYALMTEKGYDYSFNPNACESCGGNCCTGESGYIYLNQKEIEAIATFLELSIKDFKEEYLFKNGYKFSIKERIVGVSHDCIFFDRKINGCGIYPVRPTQCRTFPFWSYFKTHKDELQAECPGIIFNTTKEENV